MFCNTYIYISRASYFLHPLNYLVSAAAGLMIYDSYNL